MADATYQPKVYREQGGDRQVCASGGSIDVESGGEIDIESGGALKLAGTQVTATAAELNGLDVSVTGAGLKLKQIAISADFDNTEQASGFSLPAKAVVLDVWLDVTTADTSETLDVGTDGSGSNDPDGFLDAASVNATGVIRGEIKTTTGSNNNYIGAASSHTLGALLMDLLAGEDVAGGGDGNASRSPDVASGGEAITYTGSSGTNTMRGTINILYIEIA